ncbi:carboxymuconolactone decarboxylase family protein [Acrocarpospora catenulata]|uniref:carboxymuconolactone decarboxylase family protein n=1 Tax=Acrocarpospora catenulata TaxID=2836182 RepID=UPI001BDB14D8|nr:carboxymuconolactone decarboxylase family protein [Acrocarpospora catenulata]
MSDRLPFPPELTEAQREAVKCITAGPRGEISGPFVPLLRSPELMTRLQLVGEHLRFGGALDDDLRELVILTVARRWDQEFEWAFHHPIALATGVPAEAVESVGQGLPPAAGRPELRLVWDLIDELQRTGGVGDQAYGAALAALGEEQVVAAVATAGYYTTLAMVMNVARTPPPPGGARLPDR